MGPSRRSFFQSTNTAVLEQSVDVFNNNTAQCQNYTVRIRRAVLDRENEFNVSLRAQGKISFIPQSDGNQPLSDLVTRPVVIYSPKAEVVSVSACTTYTSACSLYPQAPLDVLMAARCFISKYSMCSRLMYKKISMYMYSLMLLCEIAKC